MQGMRSTLNHDDENAAVDVWSYEERLNQK